jgi:hypothetical protein
LRSVGMDVTNQNTIRIVVLPYSTTIASATTIYHLSSLPTPTEAQKNLITILNTTTGTGATAIFGLLNDNDKE